MLKIVVFDSGYGGELFADRLEEELPVIEVIRVIDWRHADKIQSNPREARQLAKEALSPYINKVDLIIFANHLLTITSLKHFQRKFKGQKFLGLNLPQPKSPTRRDTLVLTTRPVKQTVNYYNFIFRCDRQARRLRRRARTVALDDWPAKIDDGELSDVEIRQTLKLFVAKEHLTPSSVILACSHFSDIKPALRQTFGCTLRIQDSFDDAIKRTCKTLNIRGGTGRKQK